MASRAKDGENSIVLMLQGKPAAVRYETVDSRSIQLDPENPRVRLQLHRKFGDRKVTEPDLIEVVRTQPGFPHLQRAIRENNGLHDPLIVRHNSVVAEGNSRATVLRILRQGKEDDTRWHSVPIMRLPKDVTERMIATLLASHHVGGKTPWRKYAKAEQLSELKSTYGLTVAEIAQATRMSPGDVEDYLVAFDYFQNELAPGADPDVLESKFSHALEFVSRKNLDPIRKDPEKRELVTRLIREDKLTGLEVRHVDKMFKDKKAAEALKKGRVEVAKRAIEKKDPTLVSKFLKKMQSLDQALEDLPTSDLTMLKENPAAAQILIRLHSRIAGIAKVAGITLGEINGAARAKRA